MKPTCPPVARLDGYSGQQLAGIALCAEVGLTSGIGGVRIPRSRTFILSTAVEAEVVEARDRGSRLLESAGLPNRPISIRKISISDNICPPLSKVRTTVGNYCQYP